MVYSAKVYNVMIASPSDVHEERDIVRDAIYSWNDIHSSDKKIVLLPKCWENSTYPETGDRPQEIINKQILSQTDVLIGIFRTRFGSPTGEHKGGTIEEITRHSNSDKPTMVYFAGKTNENINNLDTEQIDSIKKFRKDFPGLYHDYDSPEDLGKKISDHLSLMVNQNKYFQNVGNGIENTIEEKSSQYNKYHTEILGKAAKHGGSIVKTESVQEISLSIKNTNPPLTLYSSKDKKDLREKANWFGALRDLKKWELIVDRYNKGFLYELTDKGYKVSDELSL
jgi:hypothetical protein